MALKRILESIDKVSAKILGLQNNVRPNIVKKTNNSIVIYSNESNKRYTQSESIDEFLNSLSKVDKQDRQKLGITLGKALGKDLVISFDVNSNEENSHDQ